MKRLIVLLALLASFACSGFSAVTTEQEKEFVDIYRNALEKSDAKAQAGFLSTDGAEPETIEFIKGWLTRDFGAKITEIRLEPLDAAAEAAISKPMPMSNGKLYKLPLKPVRMLVFTVETGDGPRTRRLPIAEKEGKLVITVPVPAEAK